MDEDAGFDGRRRNKGERNVTGGGQRVHNYATRIRVCERMRSVQRDGREAARLDRDRSPVGIEGDGMRRSKI